MATKRNNKKADALDPFDGRDVLATAVSITKAGDGLSKALQVDPTEMHVGETRHIVLECTVSKITFEPIKDTEALQRTHVLQTVNATLIDEKAVRDALDEQAERIERASGVLRLPIEDGQEGEGGQ